MTSHEQDIVILAVQMEVEPAGEDALNEWYYAHVPRVISAGGYRFGARYVSAETPRVYLALYEIETRDWVPRLVGRDPGIRSDVVNAEAELCARLRGVNRVITELYEHIGTARTPGPLLRAGCGLDILRTPSRPAIEDGPSVHAGIPQAVALQRVAMRELAHHDTLSEGMVIQLASEREDAAGPPTSWRRYRPLAKYWRLQ